jgi:protein-S-isoprenylcysteine O-methyltransferase Ste14
MYLSLMLLGIGVSLKNPTWVSVVLGVVNCAALAATALKEEKEMVRKFGRDYETYMARSKRFLPYIL